MAKLAPAERFVLLTRHLHGCGAEEMVVGRFFSPADAFSALRSMQEALPDLYGGMTPKRRLVVLEQPYQPHHAKLPRRVPGLAYALSIAPEAVEREYPAERMEAT